MSLPTELVCEVIQHAARPHPIPVTTRRPYYATAIALCSVSYAVRQETMPHLLHTVVLGSPSNLLSFTKSLRLQFALRKSGSRLALRYAKLIRRFWSTCCLELVHGGSRNQVPDYDTIYDIIRDAQVLGLDGGSQHLLCKGLSDPRSNPTRDWECRRLICSGRSWWWRSLTNDKGRAVLCKITHLGIWIQDDGSELNITPKRIPTCLQDVPFCLMPSLTHFAFVAPPSLSGPDIEWIKQRLLEWNPEAKEVIATLNIYPIVMNGWRKFPVEILCHLDVDKEIWQS